MDLLMFGISVVLLVFFLVCGVQFRRGQWLGLFLKQKPAGKKHPSKKKGDPRKEERARQRELERRKIAGTKLSNVVLFAAFAVVLQIISQVCMKLAIEPWGAILFMVTFVCFIGVFALMVYTMRTIEKL